MSTANVIVRYDGPALSEHQMDVADLAPALMGLSDLCKFANNKFNGDRSSVKVLIRADIEQRCIQFDLQIVQSAWDYTKDLLAGNDIRSAKEILEWLGILIPSIGSCGVFGILK